MKRALMGFLPLNGQFSRQIKCLIKNKNSPYTSVTKVAGVYIGPSETTV
jgi:hypothetical protein